jgi:hypothetical protein
LFLRFTKSCNVILCVINSIQSHSLLVLLLSFALNLLVSHSVQDEPVPLNFIEERVHMILILKVEEVALKLTSEEDSILSLELSAAVHLTFFPVTGELMTILKELELTEAIEEVLFKISFIDVIVR